MIQKAYQQKLYQKKEVIEDDQIKFKLINDSNEQIGFSDALEFDKNGQTMISGNIDQVRIWNFEQGRLELSCTYQVHELSITSLVYSKQSNNFISGSDDYTIICWQQINPQEWKHSQPYKQHNGTINCLMLNKNEDQLISGSCDYTLRVWNVDFQSNELTYLYSLNNHDNTVRSFSFNQQQTIMASCGFDKFIIWEKGLQGKWEFKYKQQVAYGSKIILINDQQLLWVTLERKIDDILVFEQQNGVFQQNNNKTIKLLKNNKCEDYFYFPIIHNRDRNIILVRHKHHIYLIRELNDGTFIIIASLDCQIQQTFGTMTMNGQYLVVWDFKYKKYSSYEIQNI
ncbi:unnamed protein product [Paramecium sonneborni]|uniref:WD40-repeat-containing domain n=1 Tax=Paramecium sonneborni TaxID=65129 RepID=A0A8S1QTR0_9CILI|nr:unnamed protein product [Paramecium sonneborni]